MPTIQISETVKTKLSAMKENAEHTSYDSVVRSLLLQPERCPLCNSTSVRVNNLGGELDCCFDCGADFDRLRGD